MAFKLIPEHTDGLLTGFDEGLWSGTIETVNTQLEGTIFGGGME